MAKSRTQYLCVECGAHQPRWLGRCPDCGSWESVQEQRVSRPEASSRLGTSTRPGQVKARPVPIQDVEPHQEPRLATGIDEFDRVLGGGLVPGSTILLSGEPGVGKSTLLLETAQSLSRRDRCFLYVTGEESAAQVKLRADRLGPSGERLLLFPEYDLDAIEQQILELQADVVGIDSIQTVRWQEIPSAAGGVLQVREVTARLLTLARGLGFPLLLVGHVTKDGNVAGPRVLEHMVDSVLTFDGERTQGLRILRASKNRFGSTQEVGLFEMESGGLTPVENPSRLLLGERRTDAPGSATAAILEGTRPLLVEIQALASSSAYGSPARKVTGLDGTRLSMLAAVIEKRLGFVLRDQDIYANAVGGVRIQCPSADMALAAAILSSLHDRPVPRDRIFAGEVGLLGEVRPVTGIERRLEEAQRLGFTSACVPAGTRRASPGGLARIEIPDLAALADIL